VSKFDQTATENKRIVWFKHRTRERYVAKQMSKAGLIQAIAEEHADKLTLKDVKGVLESLTTIGHKQLRKSGEFLLPGFAKFRVIKKPATKAHKGINPFTKEPMMFKAKLARKILRARPVKAGRDAIA
jgi:nucleoid DNA-binding protein